jgi:hypothetical protein
MGVEEYRNTLNEMFLRSGIKVFSEVQAKGFRFTQSQITTEVVPPAMDPVYSLVSFAITGEEQAKTFLGQIKRFNNSNQRSRALHAFQIKLEDMV